MIIGPTAFGILFLNRVVSELIKTKFRKNYTNIMLLR